MTRIAGALLLFRKGVAAMKKSNTHFEQIPIDLVKALVAKRDSPAVPMGLACRICGHAIHLEDCKTDASGRAVHERCYVSSLIADLSMSQRRATPSKPRA
jgi:hypothetical protein